MKQMIKMLDKFDLYIEMSELKQKYSTVEFSEIENKVINGCEYWIVIATI